MPVIHESQENCFLGLGNNFLTLFKNQNPGLDHYCIVVEKFNADSALETSKRQGLKPRRPSGTDRIDFPDRDGLEVQLSSVDQGRRSRRKENSAFPSSVRPLFPAPTDFGPLRREAQINFLADSLAGRGLVSPRRSRDICAQERATEKRRHRIIRQEFYVECMRL